MTPCVIAAAGLNRRVPGSRHLPNERLQIPDCTLAGSPTHRAPYLKSPIWIVGSRFRSIRNRATVFGAWEKPTGKSRLGRIRLNRGERRCFVVEYPAIPLVEGECAIRIRVRRDPATGADHPISGVFHQPDGQGPHHHHPRPSRLFPVLA